MKNEKQKLNETFMDLLYLIRKYHMLTHQHGGPLADTSRGQGRILAILKLKPEMTTKDLSYLLGIRQQSLNEMLKKLEKEGYISRNPSPKDRRVMLISLTEKGKAVKQIADDNSGMLDDFSEEELRDFNKYLTQLCKAYNKKIKEITTPEDEAKFDEFYQRIEKMREKMGDEELRKFMQNNSPFGPMFHRPF